MLGGLTEFDITRAFELQPQKAVDGGGIPSGLQPLEIQRLTQHTHSFMGGGDDGPTQTGGLNLTQQAHRQKRLATPSESAENEGRSIGRGRQPGGKSIRRLLLIRREFRSGGHPNPAPITVLITAARCRGDPTSTRPGRATAGPTKLPTST